MCLIFIQLQSLCDEKTWVLFNQNNKIEKLKRALTRSKQSNDGLQQLSGKLKAKYQEITSDLTAITQTVKKHEKTIEMYKSVCSMLIIQQQQKSYFDSLSRWLIRQKLCNMIEVLQESMNTPSDPNSTELITTVRNFTL